MKKACNCCQSFDNSNIKIENGKDKCYCCTGKRYVDPEGLCDLFKRSFDFLNEYPDNIKAAVYWWINKMYDTSEEENITDINAIFNGYPSKSKPDYKSAIFFGEILCKGLSLKLKAFPYHEVLTNNAEFGLSNLLEGAAIAAGCKAKLPKDVKMLVSLREVQVVIGNGMPEILWASYHNLGKARQHVNR